MSKVLVVGGSGRVGLPLSLFFHNKGLEVFILDPDYEKNQKIRSGTLPFLEDGIEEWLKNAHVSTRFSVHENTKHLRDKSFDVCVVIIGTPLIDESVPDYQSIPNIVQSLHHLIKDCGTLILRSTITPGTTSLVENQLVNEGREDIRVVFAPERIAEGSAYEELSALPQIIGANSKQALESAEQFFTTIGMQTLTLNALEAECAKLFSNAYRFIHFSIATLFYLICEDQGLDYARIKNAMTWNYPRLKTIPFSGYAGGPCLIKDSVILNSFQNFTENILESNLLINKRLVSLVIQKVQILCPDSSDSLIGILGIGFKAGSDDLRESFGIRVIEALTLLGYNMVYFDKFARTEMIPYMDVGEMAQKCSLLIMGNMDKAYSDFDFSVPMINVWM